ncbi:hypothetical protein H312_00766 [Anncaliia algerae PRA339]|uniref:Uncharacterized protein n=1 Tax=Anncaliia algerae PRA339 TaxID=1288291 RepID=A0A059F3S9_9MICR|nr:hypothetical protein H312_00766 [Anncaliia algerae PRA339]
MLQEENLFKAINTADIKELECILEIIGKFNYKETIDAIVCNKNTDLACILILLKHFINNKLFNEFNSLLSGILTIYKLQPENLILFHRLILTTKEITTTEEECHLIINLTMKISRMFFEEEYLLESFQSLMFIGQLILKCKKFPNRQTALVFYSTLSSIFLKGNSFFLFLNCIHKVILLSEKPIENHFLKDFVKNAISYSKLKNEEENEREREKYKGFIQLIPLKDLEVFFDAWDGKIGYEFDILKYFDENWKKVMKNESSKEFLNQFNFDPITLELKNITFTQKLFSIRDFYRKVKEVKVIPKEEVKNVVKIEEKKKKEIKKKEKTVKKDHFTMKYNIFRLGMKEKIKKCDDIHFETRKNNYEEEICKAKEKLEEKKALFMMLDSTVSNLIEKLGEKIKNPTIKEPDTFKPSEDFFSSPKSNVYVPSFLQKKGSFVTPRKEEDDNKHWSECVKPTISTNYDSEKDLKRDSKLPNKSKVYDISHLMKDLNVNSYKEKKSSFTFKPKENKEKDKNTDNEKW